MELQEGYGTHEQEALADTGPDISPTSALDAVTPPPLPRVEPGAAGACGPQAAPRPVVRRQSWRRPRPAPLLLLLLLPSVVRPTRLPARRRSRPLLLPALHASTPPLPSPSPSNQRAPILIAREAPHGLGSKGVRQQWDSKPHAQPPLRLAPVLHPPSACCYPPHARLLLPRLSSKAPGALPRSAHAWEALCVCVWCVRMIRLGPVRARSAGLSLFLVEQTGRGHQSINQAGVERRARSSARQPQGVLLGSCAPMHRINDEGRR